MPNSNDTTMERVAERIRRRRRNDVVPVAVAVPATAIVALALQMLPPPWSDIGRGLLVAAASLVVGALLGFLFGIPRSLQNDRTGDGTGNGQVANPANGQAGSPLYGVNTNLEQISDWLTKILVGVGLIQFASIGRAADQVVSRVGDEFTGDGGRVTAGALMTVFTLTGFLAGYIITRTTLTHIFAQFGVKELRHIVDDQVSQRFQRDGDAMRMVIQQLDDAEPEVAETALREALKTASPGGRAHVLLLTDEARRRSWRDPVERHKVNRTVRILRALTELGPTNHRYWGAYGFALKDTDPPANEQAVHALNQAIEQRGDPRTSGKEFYEFARAILRLRLLGGAEPDEETRAAIVADVAVAWSDKEIRRRIQSALEKAPGMLDFADRENRLLKPYLPPDPGRPGRS